MEKADKHLCANCLELLTEISTHADELSREREKSQELEIENAELRRDAAETLACNEALEEQLTEPTELVAAANRLLSHLHRSFGVERWDETLVAFELFRAMDDLRDALREPNAALAKYVHEHKRATAYGGH
jgi:hypothetical protein